MNWKSYVEKKNAETFVLPQHWDSREAVANQLECSPDKVDDALRPGLRSGEIQKQQFRVWDADLKRIVTVVAYAETAKINGTPAVDVERIKSLRKDGKSWTEIGKALGIKSENARGIYRRATSS